MVDSGRPDPMIYNQNPVAKSRYWVHHIESFPKIARIYCDDPSEVRTDRYVCIYIYIVYAVFRRTPI